MDIQTDAVNIVDEPKDADKPVKKKHTFSVTKYNTNIRVKIDALIESCTESKKLKKLDGLAS